VNHFGEICFASSTITDLGTSASVAAARTFETGTDSKAMTSMMQPLAKHNKAAT
jgi:hypothetical protein